ncbi:MAG: elongation factor P [Deltaproteobacteria bacterium]|nr:elongation factor P [Deltaproteobacteria bacterium]
MISATQIRQGMIIVHGGQLFRVMNVTHLTPGNKRAIIHTQLRNLKSGTQAEVRFSSDDKIDRAILELHEMEYLYAEGEHYHFMNTATYEQVSMSKEMLGNAVSYLLPNTKVECDFYDGQPVGIELPPTVTLKVVEAEPTVKRGTASSSYKQATLETGAAVRVPPFVEAGDVIKVNPATGEYVERG